MRNAFGELQRAIHAFAMNDALVMAGIIDKAEKDAAGKQRDKATKCRYLLPLYDNESASENEEDD